MFYHELKKSIIITNDDTEDGRYYTTESGNIYPSVTTVLGRVSDKRGLKIWRDRVGDQAADDAMARACSRGTLIHDLCEKYLMNEAINYSEISPYYLETFAKFKSVFDKYVKCVYGCELGLFNDTLGTAGRTDLIANFDGILSIVDFKTSEKAKQERYIKNYFLQATCYGMMAPHIYELFPKQIVIIIVPDKELTPQIFIKPIHQYAKETVELFRNYKKEYNG